MENVKPITPKEVIETTKSRVSEITIEVVNELLQEKWTINSKKVILSQEEIVTKILEKDSTIERHRIFEEHWLDFEHLYREIGWNVVYNKPPYYAINESPTFTFSIKEKK